MLFTNHGLQTLNFKQPSGVGCRLNQKITLGDNHKIINTVRYNIATS
jgi:hypothetical protein